jgi:hypothetical protein
MIVNRVKTFHQKKRLLKHPRKKHKKNKMNSMIHMETLINGFIMAVVFLMSFNSKWQVRTAGQRREI